MSFFKEFLSKFPSSFTTVKGSNNWKLTKFFTDDLDTIKSGLKTIDKYRNVNYAEGNALDNLGVKYGVQRGQASDDYYRMMIRAKIVNRRGNTTVNGILFAMKTALNIDIKGVKIDYVELDGVRDPLAIRIANMPLVLAQTEFEQKLVLDQIQSTLAVGIRLREIEFETSTFSSEVYLGTASIVNTTVKSLVNYDQLDLRPIVRDNLYVGFGHNQIVDTSVQANTAQFKK